MADLFDVVVARKLSGGGGGGSSDFSTAKVTIVNNGETNLYLQSVIIYDDVLMSGANLFSNSTQSVTFVVYLAGDPCETMILDHEGGTPISSTDVSVTGGVEDNGDFFTITGDGTITIGGGEA